MTTTFTEPRVIVHRADSEGRSRISINGEMSVYYGIMVVRCSRGATYHAWYRNSADSEYKDGYGMGYDTRAECIAYIVENELRDRAIDNGTYLTDAAD
jgi:hypothetical protein